MRHSNFLLAVCAAILAAVLPGDVVAQAWLPRGQARVAGVVLDAASRHPIVRTRICRVIDTGPPVGEVILCAMPDSLGRYVLDSLPEGLQTVTATCSGESQSESRLLDQKRLEVGAGEEGRFDVIADAEGCDMSPFWARRGTFRGHFVSGFEASSFRACGDSVTAWATLRLLAPRPAPVWPKPTDPEFPAYYVKWEGTFRGPWHYGHLGMARYEIEVERILEVRHPGPTDCL
jgi:hypothetical protein